MSKTSHKRFGATTRPIDLSSHLNWPSRRPSGDFWKELAAEVRDTPAGRQTPWGVPFDLAGGRNPRVILVSESSEDIVIRLRGKATHLCFLHTWRQQPETVKMETPEEGLVVGQYEIEYTGSTSYVQPIRARFEVPMSESPGPPWVAVPFDMPETMDPAIPTSEVLWGRTQTGDRPPPPRNASFPFVYALPNPTPERAIRALRIRGKQASPLLVFAVTLYRGGAHPLRHLPRRTYRVKRANGKPAAIDEAKVDLGRVARVEHTDGPRGARWLQSKHAGLQTPEPDRGEDLVELVAAEDASVDVRFKDGKGARRFSVGEAFHDGRSDRRGDSLQVLGPRRQWVQVTVLDASTGEPTPVRAHFSGSRGEYLPPYGHHAQVNANWFEDYGADVVFGGRHYAYVPGTFTTDIPVGDVYVELYKGFEYTPLRTRVRIRPGQKTLALRVKRWKDLRSRGWVTADTHVHFVSPHTAWLEAQAEGVNVVNLLASQWGRLFTNVGDLTGKPGVAQDDTIVFVGTENRNHMLGHMSMLGTQDLPVFPMCCGGPGEAWIGDPDFRMLAEWALENRRKGGVVIRPHFPSCGHTEDPVPILKGLVDALEIRDPRGDNFSTQEWYRYLNCGYRVAVCGGTDKMGAYSPIGWMRTYAKLDPKRRFTYAGWADAVRSGRTVSTTGPLIDLTVDGKSIGDQIVLKRGGGTLEFKAVAECFAPLQSLEVVVNGRVVHRERGGRGATSLSASGRIRMKGSGWIAARCTGAARHPAGYMSAHTSPVYVKHGDDRLFDGPAAQHMLALVEGGIEYLNTLATVYDESSRKRMVKLFNEARQELKGRLIVEAHDHPHHHH